MLAFYVYQYEQSDFPKIDSIKYEFDFQGKSRKHIYSFGYFEPCNFWHVPGYIIEGFGFKDGPFRGQVNRRLVHYCEGTLEQCNIVSSTQKESLKSQHQIQLIPNPAHDLVTLHLDDETSQHINQYLIRDLQGKIVKDASPVIVGRENTISTLWLPSGMYIVQFLKDGNIVHSEKFIISH